MTLDVLTADAAGWIAAMLTACCFACTRMLRLRALALMANLAFIAYGSLAGLMPVLVLHLMLAPLNAWHLVRQWRAAQAAIGTGHGAAVLRRPPLSPSSRQGAGCVAAADGAGPAPFSRRAESGWPAR